MKAYFNFSKGQKIGVISLSVLIVFLTVLLNVNYHRELPDVTAVDLDTFHFASNVNVLQSDLGYSNQPENHSENKSYDLFIFNPNELDQDGWEKLGFSSKQASAIVKYKDNYGPFEKNTDLKKIYVISDEKYEEIEPFIVFPNTAPPESQIKKFIDVNIATQEELESIRGIGPVFAKRTIKYRELLGGYVVKSQFSEIYGMTEDALEALQSNTRIDLESVNRIRINSDTKDQIRKHPYFKDWALVTAIIEERDKRKLVDLEFLVQKGLIDQEEVDKLSPYISFE